VQKKLSGKLVLSRETLRSLSPRELDHVVGGQVTNFCTTFTSSPTEASSCPTCVVTACTRPTYDC
jgi:hypothetical protein